uniref:Uncharacterized protein n=1 Tax=Varanus komodoensis TaxID=61221 RepID=A0A8D2IZ94_VARKO
MAACNLAHRRGDQRKAMEAGGCCLARWGLNGAPATLASPAGRGPREPRGASSLLGKPQSSCNSAGIPQPATLGIGELIQSKHV